MKSPKQHSLPALVSDVGGTNARFRIIMDSVSDPLVFENVRTADFDTIESAIKTAVLDKCNVTPNSAIIAAAGPITKNGLNLTNCHWNIEPDTFLTAGIADTLILMNDFEAQALSLPYLGFDDLAPLGGSENPSQTPRTKAVIGPGTGLGVGLLVRAGEKWIPVAGEGGHVDLGPRSARERIIWDNLETVEGRISAEQVLCGDGLLNVFQACCKADGVETTLTSPADISSAAMEDKSAQAVEALNLFCTCLGRVAGDLAITSMARGGVYIAGGIGQKILPFLAKSRFRAAFDDKEPHGHLMNMMSTFVVTHPVPALIGLTAYARNPEEFALDIDHRMWG